MSECVLTSHDVIINDNKHEHTNFLWHAW